MTKNEKALLAVLWEYGDEMRAGAGWRENDVMNRAEHVEAERDGRAAVITLYTAPDDDGRRDSAQYHTGRHCWTNRYFLGIDTEAKTFSRERARWYSREDVAEISKTDRRRIIEKLERAGYIETNYFYPHP